MTGTLSRMRRTRHTSLWSLVRFCNWLIAGLLCLGGVALLGGYRLNVMPSIPLGAYRVAPPPAQVTRGQLVRLPVPASVQPWLSPRYPLLKPVAAVAGDAVCVTDAGLWVRGEYYGAVEVSANGLTLPYLRGCRVVQAGEVFLASREPRSLDSRYFGMVGVAAITGIATPVWIWE